MTQFSWSRVKARREELGWGWASVNRPAGLWRGMVKEVDAELSLS